MKLVVFWLFLTVFGVQEILDSKYFASIPLKKINFSVEEKQEQFSLLMNYQSSRISSNIGEGNKGKLSLKNFSNSQYVGRVGIGSPPQYLDVILDTGSANFWVNSKLCHDYACETHNSYDNKLSETYENLGYVINVQFGTGEIRGEINYESVTVAGITLSHQSFGEITDEIGEVFVQGKFSGILGLAFPKMAAFNFDPIFDTMIKSDKLENNLFTFYYSDDDNSEVSFGKIDYSKFIGDIHWTQVIDEYYWVIELKDIKLGNKSLGLCSNGCKAAVDTGTSLLTAPPDHLNALIDLFKIDCQEFDKNPDLVFNIDGNDYVVKAKDFVLESMGDCTVGIMPLKVPKPQ